MHFATGINNFTIEHIYESGKHLVLYWLNPLLLKNT